MSGPWGQPSEWSCTPICPTRTRLPASAPCPPSPQSQGEGWARAQLGLGAASLALRAGKHSGASTPKTHPKPQVFKANSPTQHRGPGGIQAPGPPHADVSPSILPPRWQRGWAVAPPSLGKGPPSPWDRARDSDPGMRALPRLRDPPKLLSRQRGLSAPSPAVCQGQRLLTPAWEGISPPSRSGRDRTFRLSGNGAFKDYTVQLQRGKTGTAAASIPPPSSSPCLIPLLLPSNTCPGLPAGSRCPWGHASPPSATPEPSFALPGRVREAG